MIRGTQNLFNEEALRFLSLRNDLEEIAITNGFVPFIPSALAEQEIFIQKAGKEVLEQTYSFQDKGGRDICLIPEVTAVIQNEYNNHWAKTLPKPIKVFYFTRCYRYERPQKGRYREFWQFGIEILGGKAPDDKNEALSILTKCLKGVGAVYKVIPKVKRGLNYYIEDGFEVEVASLGAQKQIAGGGRYKEGIGWAIGVDRLMLSLSY